MNGVRFLARETLLECFARTFARHIRNAKTGKSITESFRDLLMKKIVFSRTVKCSFVFGPETRVPMKKTSVSTLLRFGRNSCRIKAGENWNRSDVLTKHNRGRLSPKFQDGISPFERVDRTENRYDNSRERAH